MVDKDVDGMLRGYRLEVEQYKDDPHPAKHLCWLLTNALDTLEALHDNTATDDPTDDIIDDGGKEGETRSVWDVAEEGGMIVPSKAGGCAVSPPREAPISSALCPPPSARNKRNTP